MKRFTTICLSLLLVFSLLGARFGNVRVEKIPHAYGGYMGKAYTLTCDADTWTHITNGTSDLWTGSEASGIGFSADQMTILETGDYVGSLCLTVSGIAGKDFHIRVYNVTQTRVEGFEMGISTTGAGNEMEASLPLYIEGTAGDVLQLQINSTDGTDPILDDAVFYVTYLHD